MFRRITMTVLQSRWPLGLGLLLLTFLFGEAATRMQIDPSIETLFVKKSKEYQQYREFSEQYGSDYMLAVAMATPDLFAEEHLLKLKFITDEIARQPQVERVMSLSNVLDIKHKFWGVKIEPALKSFYTGKDSSGELKPLILENELYVHNLVSPDGRIANILVYLKPSGEDRHSSGEFIRKLRQVLKLHENDQVKFYIAGAPIEQYDFIRYIQRDQRIFVPVITILLIMTTWIIYRNFACMVLSMSIVFMTLIWTMGTIVLSGQELNLVTSLLAPVIMIIAVVNSIHLMNLFFEVRLHHASLKEAVALTMSQLGAPCFLAHLTTMLGFISLAFNPVPAIQSFGFFAAVGTIYSFVIQILLTPLLLPILPYPERKDNAAGHFFNRIVVVFLENLEFRWKGWIFVTSISLVILSMIGIQRLEVDTSLIKQMKADTPLAIATRFIDENLTGVYVLGFILRKKDGSPMTDITTLREVVKLKQFLENQPEIVNVNSVTALIRKIHQARENEPHRVSLPDDQGTLDTYFEGISQSRDPELWKLVSRDFRELRLEARMKAVGTKEGALMEERARDYLRRFMSEDFEYDLTGNVVLLGKMAKGLVKNQLQGFSFAFGSILLLITLMFRSLRIGLLAAVPNLLPILAVYGFMGFVGIDLSSPTAMISSIVLGMVVDASIHFLHRFKMEFHIRRNYIQALHHTFRHVGQSLVISTAILSIGFAASAFASFKPTVYLGILTSLAIILALLCTLIILPVCLIILKPFGPEKLFAKSREKPLN